jgi:hypothetical protein
VLPAATPPPVKVTVPRAIAEPVPMPSWYRAPTSTSSSATPEGLAEAAPAEANR